MSGKKPHEKQCCDVCGSRRPRHTFGKKTTPKESRAQKRRRLCRRCGESA